MLLCISPHRGRYWGDTHILLIHIIPVYWVDRGARKITSPEILKQPLMRIGQYSLNTLLLYPSSGMTLQHARICLSSTAGLNPKCLWCNQFNSTYLIYFLLFLSFQCTLRSLPIKEISQGILIRILYLSGFYRETVHMLRSVGRIGELKTQKSWWLSSDFGRPGHAVAWRKASVPSPEVGSQWSEHRTLASRLVVSDKALTLWLSRKKNFHKEEKQWNKWDIY